MRVLVCPHDMELGGSSINAIDLAAAVRELGHETFVIARPGPLADLVEAKGLPLTTVDVPTRPRPSPRAIRAIHAAARRYRVDLVHTYEFWPCVEGFFATAGSARPPVVGTIMTMGLAHYLPRSMPLTLGYRDLLDEARTQQRAAVHLLEPPVDTEHDRPGVDTTEMVGRFGLEEPALNVVIVSRTAVAMKMEGIERTIAATELLARRFKIRLVVVGGGSAFEALSSQADRVNERVGRRVVVMTGPMADPRPAYELADVVVGMGSSALRGMAFGKPVVVVAEKGFCLPVTPDTLPQFERTGFYGIGAGRCAPDADPLTEQLAELLADEALRRCRAEFGRALVGDRHSLAAGARTLDMVYRQAVCDAPSSWRQVPDLMLTAGRVLRHKVRDGGVVDRLRPRAAMMAGK